MRLSSCRMPRLKLASSAGAIAAVLALAGTAWTGEGPKNDEVFSLNRAVTIPGPISGNPSCHSTSAGSIGDLNRYYLGDRSNKAVDVIAPASPLSTNSRRDLSVLVAKTATSAPCAAPRRTPPRVYPTMTSQDPMGCSRSSTRRARGSFGLEMATVGSGS